MATVAVAIGPTPGSFPDPAAAYTSVDRGLAALNRWVSPERGVNREAIGKTVLGEPIWAYHFADPDVPVHRTVLVFAGIHALEWISSEAAFQFAMDLAVAPPRGVEVTVVPVLNVDGRRRAEADVWLHNNAYRRGNAARVSVDLNRDFAHNRDATSVWRHLLPGFHASTGSSLSQPESRAIAALAARKHYDRAASLHAFGGYLYTPWAGRWERPDDHAAFVALGREMEAAQGRGAYRTRQLSRWGFFFRAHGAEIDHLYGAHGTYAFLIEVTRSGFDWRHPIKSATIYFRWYNPVKPRAHVERTVAALMALVRSDAAADGIKGEDAPVLR